MSRRNATLALVILTVAVGLLAFLFPRAPQPLSYHNFADQRSRLGVPNFGDVASNVAFAFFGISGLLFLLRLGPGERHKRFIEPREHWLWAVVFFGMILTAFGSAYYHLAPDNNRLVWDRLPMTIVFMSLVAAMIAERIGVSLAMWLWPILLVVGAASVWQWHWTELHGAGDLRFYGAVQAYAVLVMLVLLFFPTPYTDSSAYVVVVGFYILAKLLETFDRQIFAAGHIISGHTLKHIAAALAGYWLLRMLKERRIKT